MIAVTSPPWAVGGGDIPLLTHQPLADTLGTSRVTMTRTRKQLKAEGQPTKFNQSSGQWTGDAQFAYAPRTLLNVL